MIKAGHGRIPDLYGPGFHYSIMCRFGYGYPLIRLRRTTRCSDGRQWDWDVPAGASESDIMKMFECAMQEYNLRMRGTWDMYRDSADKYFVRDDDDEDEKDIYTFTKSR